MIVKSNFYFYIFSVLCVGTIVSANCDECQGNYAACLDETTFSRCLGDVKDTKVFQCPPKTVCTLEPQICMPNCGAEPFRPYCVNQCNRCNSANKLFACLNSTAFAFCFGNNMPGRQVGICEDGYVCNLDDPKICTKDGTPSCLLEEPIDFPSSAEDISDEVEETTVEGTTTPLPTTTLILTSSTPTIPPTTMPTTTPTTTPTPEPTTESKTTPVSRSADEICNSQKTIGIAAPDYDPTCKKYISCTRPGGSSEFVGLERSCSTFFDPIRKQCVREKPSSCQ